MLVWIVDAGGFGIVFAYLLVAVSFLVLRFRAPDMPRPFRLRHGTVLGGIGILLSLGIALLYMPGSPSALRPQEWIIVGLWVVAGLILYLVSPRRATTQNTGSTVTE
jgi:amino acid transporter